MKINNLYEFLKNTKENEVVVKTSNVMIGWDDITTDATIAGFKVVKFLDKELLAKHKFAECYKFIRK
jgi:hypothetical protein